jgi:hypothetical protein
MPLVFTNMPSGGGVSWRTAAGGDAQAAWRCDWAHRGSTGGSGWVGGAAGERPRRDCGGTPASARIRASGSKMRVNKRLWKPSLGPRACAQLLVRR